MCITFQSTVIRITGSASVTRAASIRWRRMRIERLISLPMFHGMSDQDVEDVIGAVAKITEYFARETGVA